MSSSRPRRTSVDLSEVHLDVCDGNLDVVDCALHSGASVGGVVEVSDIDGPHSNADQGGHLGELLREDVKLLLERSFDLLGLLRVQGGG